MPLIRIENNVIELIQPILVDDSTIKNVVIASNTFEGAFNNLTKAGSAFEKYFEEQEGISGAISESDLKLTE